MRLAQTDIATLQHVILAELGQEGVQARLFGSRVRDDDVALSQGVLLWQ